MKIKISILSYILTFIVFTMQINALSYSVAKNMPKYNFIFAYGEIRHGDLYRLKRVYDRVSKRKQTIVVFNSVGGELNEGIKIGKFLKQHRIGSAVSKNGLCASSCALAFLGGRDLYGRKLMILPRGSKLGFHSFYYKNEANVKLSTIQRDYANVYNYAAYVRAPSYIISKMFKTNYNKMYWVKSSDRRYLGLKDNLANISLRRYAKNSGYKRDYAIRKRIKLAQSSYVKRYFNKINSVITAAKGMSLKDSTALNRYSYRNWLSSQLKYAYLKKLKPLSRNKVEAEVIYGFRNGARICSKNTYRLGQTAKGWRIISKTHRACKRKYRKVLKKLAYYLP